MEPPSVATASDLDAVTRTLAGAFRADPLWNWALPDNDRLAVWWRFYTKSALRFPWVWFAPGYAAATVWIPPGESELEEHEEEQVEPLMTQLAGPRAGEVMELLERFESSHPRDRPHYYLSLLGTHPDHRGAGLGMALLAHNLARIDAEGMPAYLESSNPANDARYERAGFVKVGELTTPDGRHTVSTMWREAR